MKILHALFALAMLLLIFAQGLFALYSFLPAGRPAWNLALDIARQDGLLVLMAGIALILLGALYLLTLTRGKANAKTISYNGPNGPVTISMRAVRDFVQRISAEFTDIISMQSNLEFRGNALHIELDVRVIAGTNLPELCQMLQERVAESIRDQLGLPAVKGVRVNVRELVQRPAAPGPDPEIA